MNEEVFFDSNLHQRVIVCGLEIPAALSIDLADFTMAIVTERPGTNLASTLASTVRSTITPYVKVATKVPNTIWLALTFMYQKG